MYYKYEDLKIEFKHKDLNLTQSIHLKLREGTIKYALYYLTLLNENISYKYDIYAVYKGEKFPLKNFTSKF